ncbi:MAG: hypothetical protein IJW31_00650 [Lentisphaeria bacterium]|nr:hypothetical protein [Lentisphaeria bacterium]
MKTIHFVGVGGIGMSGLASMYQSLGYEVSGSDRGSNRVENQKILAPLRNKGIIIYPQDGSYSIDREIDYLVYSSAIESDNPDFLAMPKNCQKIHRSEALQKIINESSFSNSIAVSGSCGKSSVCGLLSETIYNLTGEVNSLNGAIIKRFVSDTEAGNFHGEGDKFFVFEADESDKSLVNYSPDYAILLNIGTDHYSKEELAEVFATFINRVKKAAVVSEEVYELIREKLTTSIPIIKFSEKLSEAKNNLFAVNSYERKNGDIEITINGEYKLKLPIPGFHNAVNSLAVFALLTHLGFAGEKIVEAIEKFHGVSRRFDYIKTTQNGVKIYDDYAHNPEKIISCLKGAREICNGRIFLVFQPHGYGPLGFMEEPLFELLERELDGEKELFIMLEAFYAGGTSSFTPHSIDVIKCYKSKSSFADKYLYLDSREDTAEFLHANAQSGDVIMIMGARDNSLPVFAAQL